MGNLSLMSSAFEFGASLADKSEVNAGALLSARAP